MATQVSAVEQGVLGQLQAAVEARAAAEADLVRMIAELANVQAIIDADGDDEGELLVAVRGRKSLRAAIVGAQALVAQRKIAIGAIGDSALSPATIAMTTAKSAALSAIGAVRTDPTKRAAAHAALDELFGAQAALDGLRAELGIEDKPKRQKAEGGTADRAEAGVVYVNGDGQLRVRFGPDAALAALAVLAKVPGAVLRDHTFTWGEREISHEIDIATAQLSKVIAVAQQASNEQDATTPKEVRRAVAKLIKHAAHVAAGGPTTLAS